MCCPRSNNLAVTPVTDFEARRSASSAEPLKITLQLARSEKSRALGELSRADGLLRASYLLQGRQMDRRPNSFRPILGYHGCDRAVAGQVLSGDTDLRLSENSYDWLGQVSIFGSIAMLVKIQESLIESR